MALTRDSASESSLHLGGLRSGVLFTCRVGQPLAAAAPNLFRYKNNTFITVAADRERRAKSIIDGAAVVSRSGGDACQRRAGKQF